MSCHYGNATCPDTSDTTHECRPARAPQPVALEIEHRCACCGTARVRTAGAWCRRCDADDAAMASDRARETWGMT